MKIIFDNSTPGQLAPLVLDHEISTCPKLGWTRLENGEFLGAAEAAGFDLMITVDQNLSYQQNRSKRRVAPIVLGSTYWHTIRQFAAIIIASFSEAGPKVDWILGN